MSKRLPYYQSEPAEYLAGDIMYCSYSAHGVFTIIRALYWQKDCELTLTQAKKRLKGSDEFIDELINEGIIKVNDDNISINFLDEQFEKASGQSKANSENGKKGAAKRWAKKGKDSESIATPSKKDSESIALREDKIKEEEIREDKIKEDNIILEVLLKSETQFAIEKNLRNFGLEIPDYNSAVNMFSDKLIAEDDVYKSQNEIRKHFSNWLKLELKSLKKQNNNGHTETRTKEQRLADIQRTKSKGYYTS